MEKLSNEEKLARIETLSDEVMEDNKIREILENCQNKVTRYDTDIEALDQAEQQLKDYLTQEVRKLGNKEWEVGDILVDECISCGNEEIWVIESIGEDRYLDGTFRKYELKSVVNCLPASVGAVGRSVKDVPECTSQFKQMVALNDVLSIWEGKK